MTDPNVGWPETDRNLVDAPVQAQKVFDAQVSAEGERLKSLNEERLERSKAGLAGEQADADAAITWSTANRQADIDNLQAFFESMSTMAVSGIDRARSAAETVQKASAAIVTLYTGVLALVFSVTDNRLPVRGVLAPLFLGAAVVLSTAFVAYLGPERGVTSGPAVVQGLEPKTFQRLNTIIRVSRSVATRRSWCVRASVVSLGVGLAFIVLPFVSFATTETSESPSASSSPSGSLSSSASPSATPSSAPSATDWPTPPEGDPALTKILYKAQVDEVVKMRSQVVSTVKTHDGAVFFIGLIVGIALVVFVPTVVGD